MVEKKEMAIAHLAESGAKMNFAIGTLNHLLLTGVTMSIAVAAAKLTSVHDGMERRNLGGKCP